ncbi:MAG: integration host factor subunit alpha [Holosporaceae bacterium]|jgi:integration host factor subunit alpha|nr:integration host factor subunit alpha [Holosporaceae bacterium]
MKTDDTKTLTRAELAAAITDEFRVTKFVALEIVEDVLDEISNALTKGENVKISGFGTFSVRKKNGRMGRNPKTLKDAYITPRKVVSFKASSRLKEAVNKKAV